MKPRIFLACLLAIVAGCQQNVVRRGAHNLAGTVTTLYYDQVLDNLARTVVNADTLPYFGVPSQSTHINSRQFQATYTPGWDLNSVRNWLFDKQTAAFGGQVQNQESMQLLPVTNPDKILFMQIAYWRAIGYPTGAGLDSSLRTYYGLTNNFVDYDPYVKPGWFVITKDKKAAKKFGCYMASCSGTYVYVTRDNMDAFSKFTLAILDIATLDIDYFYGEKGRKEQAAQPGQQRQTERLPSPRMDTRPVPPPPIAPSL